MGDRRALYQAGGYHRSGECGDFHTKGSHTARHRITAVVTDCELPMVKAGYILQERRVAIHVGCAAHRVQSSAGRVFTGTEVIEMLGRARCTGAQY